LLTVEFERLGLCAGDSLLDLGCGGGRHAFEAYRRGGRVVALDADGAELKDVLGMMAAMREAGDVPAGAVGACVQADARMLPFRAGAFDRVIAAEVLEHVAEDETAMGELGRVLTAGGSMAVTVPSFGPEVVNWVLSDRYHARPGGHLRIYRRSTLVRRLRAAGLLPFGAHHAHALHSPYWWLRCAVGVDDDQHLLVRAYHRFLVWDITRAPLLTRAAEAALRPVIGKSLVVYLSKVQLTLGRAEP
jgi:SAM-dependent methyltransferase